MMAHSANTRDLPLDRQVLRQAAQWLVRLHPGAEPPPEAFRECERWRAQNPEHERAWQRAQLLNDQFGTLPPALARPTLNRKLSRRKALAAMGAAAAALPAVWFAGRMAPWAAWSAEYRTGTGQRRELRLADGSSVLMNAASAVDIAYDALSRRVLLRAGEILVRTAPDGGRPEAARPDAARPFVVSSEAGAMRSLDARFTVRQRGAQCRVAVLEGAVEVTPRDMPGQRLQVAAGRCLTFTAQGAGALQPAAAGEGEWARGVLVADNMRLADFLEALSHYRPGLLQCDPAVADLRLSGGFQLQDTDKVLTLLPATLPVRVVSRSRYWILVEPRASAA